MLTTWEEAQEEFKREFGRNIYFSWLDGDDRVVCILHIYIRMLTYADVC